MAKYGFRVFRFKPKRYYTPRFLRWADVPGGYQAHLARISKLLIAEQGGQPDASTPLETEPFEVGATFTDIGLLTHGETLRPSDATNQQVARWFPLSTRADGKHLSFSFLSGTRGEFDLAIGGGGDTALAGKAASRPFRAELLIPAAPEGIALIAIECVGQYCPRMSLERLLGLGSKRAALEDKNGKDEPAWYYPSCRQVTDTQFLAELLDNPQQASVVLKHSGHTASGSPAHPKFRAEWSNLTVKQQSNLADWIKMPVSERKLKSMKGLVDIIGQDDDSAYDEGYVSLRSADSGTKLYPGSAVDTFTYPIPGKTRPGASVWEAAVKDRLAKLAPALTW